MKDIQKFYVLYGVDKFDDYIKILSDDEYKKLKDIHKKIKFDDFINMLDDIRIQNIQSNLLVLLGELIEKEELKVDINNYNAQELYELLLKHYDVIMHAQLEYEFKVSLLNTTLFVFRVIVS